MLHFYYGVMGSSKTAQLLMQHYNYQQRWASGWRW